ncbi:hypothetical protein GALMADRAFT_151734 [Galerina marginata CBS 339.88]|uniref:Fungal lipase-type domain-containing protein n=1 Tax=Galerina marginata (strain CBS 339.88) TaxID=685588 RepID=A0A067TUL2_GALM3|nr:hypothetical protein GALMADRAFT_151734 [Galerina marginata CBS 339.88]
MFALKLLSLLFVNSAVRSNPLPRHLNLDKRATEFSPGLLAALQPFSLFAAAAYCVPSSVQTWDCGDFCARLPGFEPTLVGGDGNAVQFFFVGYWPQENAVVVAHQGTDPTALKSILTDLFLPKGPLSSTLFPGVPTSVSVHEGFRNEHALTATKITDEVKRLITTKNPQKVITVGHSLGAALASLDALMLRLVLPASIPVSSRTFGLPRVGNTAFAQFFDFKVPDFNRVNNDHDLVPIIPGRFLGFTHPQGEIHIQNNGSAVSCSGNDNATDPQCTIKAVPDVQDGNIIDHLGPYNGVFMGNSFC